MEPEEKSMLGAWAERFYQSPRTEKRCSRPSRIRISCWPPMIVERLWRSRAKGKVELTDIIRLKPATQGASNA